MTEPYRIGPGIVPVNKSHLYATGKPGWLVGWLVVLNAGFQQYFI